jgi:proline iminopeptidase
MKCERTHIRVDTCSDGTPIIIAVYLYGNPKGYPVVYLHGGPGDRFTHAVAAFYDLNKYRLVGFDQRGCGNSTPRLLIENNTTQHLLQDIEHIRTHIMNADKWLVAGGSWGSSLAFCYAQTYPQHTSGLILRGFTDLTYDEINNPVFNHIFTDQTDEFFSVLGMDYKKHSELQLIKKIYKRFLKLLPKNNLYHTPSAEKHILKHLNKTDKKILELFADEQVYTIKDLTKKKKRVKKKTRKATRYYETPTFRNFADALITYHYGVNDFFLQKNQLALEKNVRKIRNIPTYFVQGRFDVVCPFYMAYQMNKRLNKSTLHIAHGGHTISNKDIKKMLRMSSDDFIRKKSRS